MNRHFLSLSILSLLSATGHAGEKIQFNRDVRPILSNACFHCHGPDEKERKGGFRLDLKEEAFKPGKSGLVPLVPGKPDDSELLVRIFLEAGDSDSMPPKESGKSITAAERETLQISSKLLDLARVIYQ